MNSFVQRAREGEERRRGMSYLCNQKKPCKHLRIEYDVFTCFGDVHVSNAQWYCMKSDDERCIPNCKLYECGKAVEQ